MGKLVPNTLFQFTGKVGNVIGRIGKDGSCIISAAPGKRKSSSPRQLENEAKFKKATSILKPIKSLVRITFRDRKNILSGYNLAFSYTRINVVDGIYPHYSVNWPMLSISSGSLKNPSNVKGVLLHEKLVATWDFQFNSLHRSLNPKDLCILVVYCPSMEHAVYALPAERYKGVASIDLKGIYGHTIHAYLAFISENNNETSDSIYLGEFKP